MENKETWNDLLDELIGRKVVVETSDGSIRRGLLSRVTGQTMNLGGTSCQYPMMIYFDHSDIEGIDLRAIVSIGVEE